MATETRIPLFLDNVVRLRFDLALEGLGAWDVSGADSITLEVTDAEGAALTEIDADIADPGADWVRGVVTVLVDDDVTGTLQTVGMSLTVVMDGETITVDNGFIDVVRRNGYTQSGP